MPAASGDEPQWLSVHLYHRGTPYDAVADRIALEVVEPFVRRCQAQDWIRGWFFIRYSDAGAHLRLRCLPSDPDVAEQLCASLEGFVCEPVAEAERSAEATLRDIERVAWTPYVPETDRYGGQAAVRVAEGLFESSSDFAVEIVRSTSASARAPRLGFALIAAIVTWFVFFQSPDAAAQMAHDYSEGYLRHMADEGGRARLLSRFDEAGDGQAGTLDLYVAETWSRLVEGTTLTPSIDRLRRALTHARERLKELAEAGLLEVRGARMSYAQAVPAIIPSYVHMTNNRLGIPMGEEAYIAHVAERSLSRCLLSCTQRSAEV